MKRHRRSLLSLLLILAAAPAEAAEARGGRPGRPRADAAAVAAARHFLCPRGGTPMRGRCRAGSSGGLGGDPAVQGWDAGLPPAAHRQAPCPEGTVPAAALAWSDATRCLPR